MHPLLPNRSSASSSGLPWSFHCQPHPFPLTLARPPPRSKIQAHPTCSPPLSSTEFFVAAWTRLFHLDGAGRDKKLKPFTGSFAFLRRDKSAICHGGQSRFGPMFATVVTASRRVKKEQEI